MGAVSQAFEWCVLVAQSCPTLCDPIDYSPPGSSSMGFCRQESRSRSPRPPPRDLPAPGIELGSPSPALQADASLSEPQRGEQLGEAQKHRLLRAPGKAPAEVCERLRDSSPLEAEVEQP